MKYFAVALIAGVLLSGSGCHHHVAPRGCGTCQSGGKAGCRSCGGAGLLAHHGGRPGVLNHGGAHRGGPHHGAPHHGGLIHHDAHLHHGSLGHPGPLGWQHGGTSHIPRLPNNVYGHHVGFIGEAGPPTPTYAYPYYTTRGPRDFLQDNPPSIGR